MEPGGLFTTAASCSWSLFIGTPISRVLVSLLSVFRIPRIPNFRKYFLFSFSFFEIRNSDWLAGKTKLSCTGCASAAALSCTLAWQPQRTEQALIAYICTSAKCARRARAR